MQRKILEKTPEKERQKKALASGIFVTLLIWAMYGIVMFYDSLNNLVSCSGSFSICLMRDIGTWLFTLTLVLITWLIFYWFAYSSWEWKKIEPKNEPKRRKTTSKTIKRSRN